MTKLQFLIIISSFIFLLFAIDWFQRKKFNALHFTIFFWGSSLLVIFWLNPHLLNQLWWNFWLNRWADLLVYLGLILLWYLYFELLNKSTKLNNNLTRLVSNISTKDIELPNRKFAEHKDRFVFLIRAYNESKTIWKVLQDIIDAWYKNILVVNDGSVDHTKKIVQKIQKVYSSVALISHDINRGGWAANKTWFNFLKDVSSSLEFDYVVTYDADDQMDIEDMKNFESILEKNTDTNIALLWSRFVEGGKSTNMPTMRKIVLRWSKFITKIFNWVVVSDPHNGYRVIWIKALKKINIFSDDFTYASEILDWIKINHIPYFEVPVSIKYTDYSLSKWQKNLNAFKILIQLIYTKFFYK